jgi:hypothetical protein
LRLEAVSTLPEREVAFLRALVANRPAHRRAGPVALTLLRERALGTLKGARILYSPEHHQAAATLRTNRGYPLEAGFAGGMRQDASPGGSEKSRAAGVMEHLVAIVPINVGLQVPSGTRFLAADWRALDLAQVDAVLVCENLEPMYDLASYRWLESDFVRGRRVLAVFRGRPGTFRIETATEFVRRCARPVLGFYDFDPSGLVMAASQERLEALCLPPQEPLSAAVRRNRRTHLFTDQLEQARPVLDRLPPGAIRTWWDLLRSLQCGLDQEHLPR